MQEKFCIFLILYWIFVFLYLCFFVFLYFCIFEFLYFCIFVFVCSWAVKMYRKSLWIYNGIKIWYHPQQNGFYVFKQKQPRIRKFQYISTINFQLYGFARFSHFLKILTSAFERSLPQAWRLIPTSQIIQPLKCKLDWKVCIVSAGITNILREGKKLKGRVCIVSAGLTEAPILHFKSVKRPPSSFHVGQRTISCHGKISHRPNITRKLITPPLPLPLTIKLNWS